MKTEEIIAQVARKNNMTPERVEEELRKAMRAGMASTDPLAQKLWKQIAPDGKEPSIEAFLEFCANNVKKMMDGRG